MSEQNPTIVLVHGAWADASGWSAVILRLQADGFTVYSLPNPLRGLPQDSAYLHDFLTRNPALAGQPVVLTGHSYGGAVITNAAVGAPQVKALVYVDAFYPRPGRDHRAAGRRSARIVPAGKPRRYLQPGALPRRDGRRRRPLHQAQPRPRRLCLRADPSPGRGHRRHPAATGGQRLQRTVRGPGLEPSRRGP